MATWSWLLVMSSGKRSGLDTWVLEIPVYDDSQWDWMRFPKMWIFIEK